MPIFVLASPGSKGLIWYGRSEFGTRGDSVDIDDPMNTFFPEGCCCYTHCPVDI